MTSWTWPTRSMICLHCGSAALNQCAACDEAGYCDTFRQQKKHGRCHRATCGGNVCCARATGGDVCVWNLVHCFCYKMFYGSCLSMVLLRSTDFLRYALTWLCWGLLVSADVYSLRAFFFPLIHSTSRTCKE